MVTTKLITVEDLEQITEVGRYDLIRGELITMAPAGEEHGVIAGEIGGFIREHVKRKQLGRFYAAETGFILHRDPDVVLAPDAAFVRSERLPSSKPGTGYFVGAPDLAVEVLSPSESTARSQEKVLEYLEAGTRLVWIVHPPRRTVTVYRADHSALLLLENDQLDGEDVLPGFSIRVGEIFE
jgi:Uma2 family endonuclease